MKPETKLARDIRSQLSMPGLDKQMVLRAATEVFSKHGYDASTMDDVAEFLGITRPALYYYVSSKQELLRLALEPVLTALESIRYRDEAQQGPSAERLRFFIKQMIEVVADQPTSVALLLRLRGNTDMERAALHRRHAIEVTLGEIVSGAGSEGHLREDIDPGTAGRLLLGMVNSTAEWYRPWEGPSPQQLADEIIGLGFHGMSSSPQRRRS